MIAFVSQLLSRVCWHCRVAHVIGNEAHTRARQLLRSSRNPGDVRCSWYARDNDNSQLNRNKSKITAIAIPQDLLNDIEYCWKKIASNVSRFYSLSEHNVRD